MVKKHLTECKDLAARQPTSKMMQQCPFCPGRNLHKEKSYSVSCFEICGFSLLLTTYIAKSTLEYVYNQAASFVVYVCMCIGDTSLVRFLFHVGLVIVANFYININELS